MVKTIREQLFERAEEDYKKFSAALIPTVDNMLGVRLPILRQMGQEIVKGDWRTYLANADDDYFEEVMLQGIVIGCAEMDVEERLQYIAAFVPKINNWSVCDSFCVGLKFTLQHKQAVWDFLQEYLSSDQEYDIRFGVVMLLHFYIEDERINDVLALLDQIKHDGFYAKMAVAWALSICYIKQPVPTMAYFKNNTLDTFTYNKALQKITESLRVDKETKAAIYWRRSSTSISAQPMTIPWSMTSSK